MLKTTPNTGIATLTALLAAASALATIGFPATPEDLRGMATLTCSGALVRAGRGADQPALLLTNGHCATNKTIEADDAIVGIPYERGPISIYFGGEAAEVVTPSRVLYATRTGSDIALIELRSTYRELESKGAKIYELSDKDAAVLSEVQLVSGFWKEKQLCAVSHSVENLVEDVWTASNAFALKEPCLAPGGWSGTPLVDPTTQKIVGILSTSNTTGGLCTLDNPCEVDKAGNRMAFNGRSYGTRTALILECLDENGMLDLARPECKLTKPKIVTPKPTAESKPIPKPSPKAKSKSSWPKS